MCELYAINSKRTVRANAQLKEFFADSPFHPHGWGLAWYEGEVLQLHKEPLTAVDSAYLNYLLEEPVRASRLVAHIRNATRGVVSFENCHPFVGRDMTGRIRIIAHNGTILNDGLLQGYDQWISGQTDSEQVVLFLMDVINEATIRIGRALDADERAVVLAQAVETLSDFNKLNLVIDDGQRTYVHTNTELDTLFVRQTTSTAFFCTRPLGTRGWDPVPHCRLISYEDGRMVRIAPKHNHSFNDELYLEILEAERLREQAV
jgi:glutamine amidotransferase